MRRRYEWKLGRRSLQLGERTLIVGVVNVTPDSFSDGGRYYVGDTAVAHGLRLLEEGADIIDIGGESTRPGAPVGQEAVRASKPSVSADEELRRVLPAIEALKRVRPDCVLSIDTYKAEVAREAVRAGAEIVNDVSAFAWDDKMAATVSELGCGVILMHTRGLPGEWRTQTPADDVLDLVSRELAQAVERAIAAGIRRDRVVLDPGFGFGKSFDQNYPLLAHFDRLAELGFPLLAGTSRKSFIGRTVGQRIGLLQGRPAGDQPAAERLYGTLASVTASILKGAHLVRVHDVRAAVEAAAIADAIIRAEQE